MIYISEAGKEKIKNLDINKIHILADFDKTITEHRNFSSWQVLREGELKGTDYAREANEQYAKYRPIETDYTLSDEYRDMMLKQWWREHFGLFAKHKLSEEFIARVAQDVSIMKFRPGADRFMCAMHDKGVPFVIISAGIGNFIEGLLRREKCLFDDVFVLANFIAFSDGIATGVDGAVIHSLNKNETALPEAIKDKLGKRPDIILFGDGIDDIKMAAAEKREGALKIGFLEDNVEQNLEAFRDAFDIVCTDNTTFDDINKILKIY
jgi:5'-nucleotidase